MHQRARIIAPMLLLVVLASAGYWWWSQRAAAATAAATLSGSGTIEVEDVLITAEVSGRVQALFADEGQQVAAGQQLAQLDTALLSAQLDQASAAVALAEANLALLKAGASSEELTLAQASAEQARAVRDGAAQAYENAQAALQNPQELDAQLVQLRAARDQAQASLARVRASTRPEDLAAATAAQAQAQANLQASRDRLSANKTQAELAIGQAAQALVQAQARYAQAKINWEYAQETGNDPIQPTIIDTSTGKRYQNRLSDGAQAAYYAQYVQAEAAMHTAEQAIEQAKVAADAARQAEVSGIQAAEAQVQTSAATLARLQNGASREDVAQAQTALNGAQRVLDQANTTRENPLGLKAAADAAATQLATASAQVKQAEARLEQVKRGARDEQIQAAEAQLAQAQAARRQIAVQLAKATLSAPRAGIVLSRPIHEGEQANPGTALMTIGALDSARLTIYIPEALIGRVRPGQAVRVTIDSFPGEMFNGTVTFIGQEAQFTPRNVQTKDERSTTVFAVRVELPNPKGQLKPGMPADAIIVE